MAYSMTGLGEGRITEKGFDLNIVIRAVNHRFLNLQVRTPRGYNRFEPLLREIIMQRVSRGKVDVFTEFFELPEDVGEMILNRGLCRNYQNLASELSKTMNIPSGMTAERLLKISGMLTVVPVGEKDEELRDVLTRTMNKALDRLMESRGVEGQCLINDMRKYLTELQTDMDYVSILADRQPEAVRNRVLESIKQFGSDFLPEENRMEQEMLLWAVKSDITEELTRLRSHLSRMKDLLGKQTPIGRETDFVIQEIHREVNTIGSKSVILEINKKVVSMKLNVEKLREQAQNLE
ncbi:YicC family protein [bacterium]|nr:YicC family protein [bacterium]